jgi:hypothetical protein
MLLAYSLPEERGPMTDKYLTVEANGSATWDPSIPARINGVQVRHGILVEVLLGTNVIYRRNFWGRGHVILPGIRLTVQTERDPAALAGEETSVLVLYERIEP